MKRATAIFLYGLLFPIIGGVALFSALVAPPFLAAKASLLLVILMPLMFPTVCVWLWLLKDKQPNAIKILAVVGLAGLCMAFALHFASLGLDSVGKSYLALLYYPIGGGLVLATAAYFLRAKFGRGRGGVT